MAKTYPNSPLVEVVFEVKFPGELSVDCHKDEFYKSVREQFPNLLVGQNPLSNSLLVPIRLSSKDNKEHIQFSIVSFSYHNNSYKGFESFKPAALKYLQTFNDHFKVTKLHTSGLRYINHIPIVREKGVIPLSRYLHFGYQLPATVPTKLESFQTMIETVKGNGKFKIQINTTKNTQNQEILILDFDYIINADLTVSKIADSLEASHKETKDLFETFITDEFRTIMEQVD